MTSPSEAQTTEERYDRLRRAVNAFADQPCDEGCDSYGHTEVCRRCDPAAWMETQQATLDAMTARVGLLEAKLARQKAIIRWQQEALEYKNRALDAMHWVWCDGGCEGGVHRYRDEDGVLRHAALTEEVVQLAERNTQRLRRWFRTDWARKQQFDKQVTKQGGLKLLDYFRLCPKPSDQANGEE